MSSRQWNVQCGSPVRIPAYSGAESDEGYGSVATFTTYNKVWAVAAAHARRTVPPMVILGVIYGE